MRASVGRQVLDDCQFPAADAANPAEVFSGPGYTSALMPTNGIARTALWMCVASIFFPPFFVVALILGGVGFIRAGLLRGAGRHEALAAVVISGLYGVLSLLLIFFISTNA